MYCISVSVMCQGLKKYGNQFDEICHYSSSPAHIFFRMFRTARSLMFISISVYFPINLPVCHKFPTAVPCPDPTTTCNLSTVLYNMNAVHLSYCTCHMCNYYSTVVWSSVTLKLYYSNTEIQLIQFQFIQFTNKYNHAWFWDFIMSCIIPQFN